MLCLFYGVRNVSMLTVESYASKNSLIFPYYAEMSTFVIILYTENATFCHHFIYAFTLGSSRIYIYQISEQILVYPLTNTNVTP